MRQRLRSHLTYANVMATLAVFLVLGGGTAMAAYVITSNSQVAPDTISGHGGSAANKNIIAGSVNATDLAPAAVTKDKIASKAVTAGKLNIPATFTSAGLPNAFGSCGSITGWADWSPDVNQSVGYYRGPDGIVHLQGTAAPCTDPGGVIFTLPAGYRPAGSRYFLAPRPDSPPDGDRIAIIRSGDPLGAGQVIAGLITQVSLDGISFRCGPSGVNGCP
jgi:hypothetical protein